MSEHRAGSLVGAAPGFAGIARPADQRLVGAIDQWIYVFMAAFFIAITLTGFIPDARGMLAAAEAGERPPLPPVLHVHAVLMGSYLLLLLAQTTLAATGRQAWHQRLGLAAVVIVPALVVAGFLLVPTIHQQYWDMMQTAPPADRADLQELLHEADDIMLLQIQIGVLFPVFTLIGLLARRVDSDLHKRMMILAIALALPAGFDRITWIPTTLPGLPLSSNLYVLLAVAPMFAWDLVRLRRIHKAYVIWLALFVPSSFVIYGLWGTDWWHAVAPRLVGL